MDDTTRSCREFTALLGSDAPAPGGGGAAALAGALGAALCTMVASLTTGKKKYAAVEGEIQELLERCKSLQEKLLDIVWTEEELRRMMELCLEALEAAERLADIGSRLAVSDAGCAAALLHGGLRAASLNVYINTKAMPDRDAAEGLNHRCGALLHRGTALADAVFDRVKRELTTL